MSIHPAYIKEHLFPHYNGSEVEEKAESVDLDVEADDDENVDEKRSVTTDPEKRLNRQR